MPESDGGIIWVQPEIDAGNGATATIGAMDAESNGNPRFRSGYRATMPRHGYGWNDGTIIPAVYNSDQTDTDNGLGNFCDISGTNNPDQADADGDSVGDLCDLCAGFNDAVDADSDGRPIAAIAIIALVRVTQTSG